MLLRRRFERPNESPEAWLVKYDRSPKLIPDWPRSEQLAVVVLYENASRGEVTYEAYVLLDEASLKAVAAFEGDDMRRRLFFTIPRSLLEAGCPGCTAGGD